MRGAMVTILGGVALLAAASCVTDACGCSPLVSLAIVTGSVVDGTGAPVPVARVHASSDEAEGCASLGGEIGTTMTSQDGSYRMDLTVSPLGDSVCVQVFADPPFGSEALGTSDTTLLVMGFVGDHPDSAAVDLVLPPE